MFRFYFAPRPDNARFCCFVIEHTGIWTSGLPAGNADLREGVGELRGESDRVSQGGRSSKCWHHRGAQAMNCKG